MWEWISIYDECVTESVILQLGVGCLGLDYLAAVSSYPEPDAKIRATASKVLELPRDMLTFGVGLTRLCYYEALLCFAPY
jgi:hypothetical protein